MLPTLAFAPRAEDLEEDFFEAPIIAFSATHSRPEPRRPAAVPARIPAEKPKPRNDE